MSKGFALVTGASSGIGAIYADRLAARGYDLILVARNPERLGEVAARVRRESGRSVEVRSANLADRSDVAAIAATLRDDARITMLVNNAGVGGPASILESDPDAMSAMIALNVDTLMRLTLAVLPAFVARRGGTIINIASIAAVAPEILNGVYGGTKAFVLALGQNLKSQLEGTGVRIQVVLPGAVATDFWDLSGIPLQHLPTEIVMSGTDMVDAALAGLDLGEFATFPSLPDIVDWETFEEARLNLEPNLSRTTPAARYSHPRAA